MEWYSQAENTMHVICPVTIINVYECRDDCVFSSSSTFKLFYKPIAFGLPGFLIYLIVPPVIPLSSHFHIVQDLLP